MIGPVLETLEYRRMIARRARMAHWAALCQVASLPISLVALLISVWAVAR